MVVVVDEVLLVVELVVLLDVEVEVEVEVLVLVVVVVQPLKESVHFCVAVCQIHLQRPGAQEGSGAWVVEVTPAWAVGEAA